MAKRNIVKIDESKCNGCGTGKLAIKAGQKLFAGKGDYQFISPDLGYVSFVVLQKGSET